MKFQFSWVRLWAIVVKEFIQMKRDRPTFGMMVGIPLIQLVLFGYAINTNPKNLPATILAADNSQYTRSFVQALKDSEYFKFTKLLKNEAEAQETIARGDALFVVNIPPNFTRDLIRGERPTILVQADATDPAATSNAVATIHTLANNILNRDLIGPLQHLQSKPSPINVTVHAKYNPLAITQYNIIPGLLGVVLTMTLIIITALAVTRESERGTMENLLSTPARPLEVMLGKILPYIFVGYVQVLLILLAAKYLFAIPIAGSITLLVILCLPFIAANLAVGLTFSTVAKNQLQAIQLAFFFFLPSILLSGFMFPFLGMPQWAQWLGNILPLTHFLTVVRGIVLKGNDFFHVWHAVWPICLFALVAILIGLKRYRQTLD